MASASRGGEEPVVGWLVQERFDLALQSVRPRGTRPRETAPLAHRPAYAAWYAPRPAASVQAVSSAIAQCWRHSSRFPHGCRAVLPLLKYIWD